VKTSSAENTWGEDPWEGRTLPGERANQRLFPTTGAAFLVSLGRHRHFRPGHGSAGHASAGRSRA
ncbi:hypothetical protein LLE49_15060, partial [Alicyclobacillus tolerans]|uniref:hypothetical protein n=1 Tax=Alicyclobacillus tolerans TaxID=90970 RepID=UPI001F396F67